MTIHQKKFLKLLFFFLAIIGLTVAMYGQYVYSQWNPIDDHEIAQYLGTDHQLHLTEFWKTLSQTEVGELGSSLRFRPINYILRILETVVWGAHTEYWYAFRVSVLFLFLGIGFVLLQASAGSILSFGIIVYLAIQSFWIDIIGRLGASEFYGVLALTIYLPAFYILWLENENLNSPKLSVNSKDSFMNKLTKKTSAIWWLLAFSSVLLIGVKENLLVVLFTNSLLAFRCYRQNRLNKTNIGLLTVTTLLGIISIGTILVPLINGGVDFYGNSMGIMFRLKKLNHRLPLLLMNQPLFLISLLIFIGFKFKKYAHIDIIYQNFKIQFILFMIYFSQYVFYNGKIHPQTRYEFPASILIPLSFLVFFIHTKQLLTNYFSEIKINRWFAFLSMSFTIFILYNALFIKIQDYSNGAISSVKYTSQFTQMLETMSQKAQNNPQWPIIIHSQTHNNYELVFSLQRFSIFYRVQNPIALAMVGYQTNDYKETSFERHLSSDLEKVVLNGGGQALEKPFIPLQKAKQQEHCYSIVLGDPNTLPPNNCEMIARF